MALYVVTYDLVAPGRHYPQVHQAIKDCGNWARPTESTWLLDTNLTASVIRDRVKQAGDANDKIFVISAGKSAAAYNLDQEVWKWVDSKL